MIGEVFNKWTVLSDPYKREGKPPLYIDVQCSCGTCKTLTKSAVTSGQSKSCGCLQREVASRLTPAPIGERFNSLTVTGDVGVVNSRRFVLTTCSCGTSEVRVRLDQLQSGHTKSCGCLYKETRATSNLKHGMAGTPTYYSWQNMKDRCRNPGNHAYQNYGGRGISYDPNWEKFENFYADMGERPGVLELDRVDVNGNYCKENCKWSDATEQSFNRRKQQGTSSEYTGVSSSVERSKWEAKLWKHNEIVFRGRFDTELEAAIAYDEACMEHYGVRKNFPDMLTE